MPQTIIFIIPKSAMRRVFSRVFQGYCLPTLCKKASNHHANLPLEMYSFTL